MYKVWVIAHREYVAMVGTKAFVFTLIMIPILMFGSIMIMPMVSRFTGGKTHKILVYDESNELFQFIRTAAEERNRLQKETEEKPLDRQNEKSMRQSFLGQSDIWEFEQETGPISDEKRLDLSKQIRDGKLYAFVELPQQLLTPPSETNASESSIPHPTASDAATSMTPKFYSQDSFMSPVRSWLGGVISLRVRDHRIKQFGLDKIDPKVLTMLDTKIELSPSLPIKATDGKKNDGASTLDALVSVFVPFGAMMLMFMVILMAAQPMLESAMEEKNLRISELLLGSVTPTQLLGGKLLGNVAASLVIFVLYGAGGMFLLNMQGLSDRIPLNILPWFLFYQLLGVLFFSSIFITVGASVNELKEAQSMLLPVWMFLMAPMMVWFIAVRDPNGVVATALSFFPPSCPMMMVLRLASGTTVPVWHPWLGAIIMLASTFFMVSMAGKIYRAGLLRNEGVRSILQLLRRSFS